MTVHISLKRDDWVFHARPWFRPFVSWKTYPNVGAFRFWYLEQFRNIFHLYSSVRRYCIRCLSCAAGSVILAAVICDADEPCSMKTAQKPESSFTMSPRSTTRPLHFWCFLSFRILQMTVVQQRCEMYFYILVPCHCRLVSDFRHIPLLLSVRAFLSLEA